MNAATLHHSRHEEAPGISGLFFALAARKSGISALTLRESPAKLRFMTCATFYFAGYFTNATRVGAVAG
ncbi:hypothetical protein [Maricaulis sp.]|uniref:hypothetical protein n=1 Tax=Maricaulis sp. TaxID=1486257 RepID=UPI002624B7C1|nr:hypothetical protein [Maricaulis sp.]